MASSPASWGFPDNSVGKESACNAEDLGLILGWEDPLEKETGYPLQYSGLENSMVCIVHGVTKSRTRLSDFHITSPPKLINTYVEHDRERGTMKKSRTVTITQGFEQSTTLFCDTLYSFLRTISSITVVILIKESCKCTYRGFYSLGLMALNNSGNLQYSSFFLQYSEKSKHTKAIFPDVV